ncbi:MAG: hypothetical protein PVJ09_01670 [Candidatus Woesebacteria bacterium]|jgi:hypothetical protein
MTDRQRALVSSIVYVFRNRRFFNWHRIGVKRVPDGAKMYEFNGKVMLDSVDLQDDKYHKIIDQDLRLDSPIVIKLEFLGKRGTDLLKIQLYKDSSNFYGEDGDLFKFEGQYYKNSDQIEIRDYSQDKDKYVYRIIW